MKNWYFLVAISLFVVVATDCWAEVRAMKINAVACKSKDKTFEVNRWLNQGDKDAVAMEIMDGNCFMLDQGTRVDIDKYGVEWVRVRVLKTNLKVWTLKQFVY